MKLVVIIHSIVIEPPVADVLRASGIHSYTKLPVAHGQGRGSEPKFDSVVCPGRNSILLVATEDTEAEALMTKVSELCRQFRTEGIKAFMLPVDAAT